MAVEIAEITRTYGGLEGRRVKLGTRFAIDREREGLPVISKSRFQQLKDAGLAREWVPGGGAAPVSPGSVGPGVALQTVKQKPLNQSRTARKAQLKNAGAPAEPRPLTNPAIGSPISQAVKLAQSSPEDQARIAQNLGLRGRRKSSPSPLTTPTKSPLGPESSTPATAHGGDTTQAQENSTD
jgi:hypothetical protein